MVQCISRYASTASVGFDLVCPSISEASSLSAGTARLLQALARSHPADQGRQQRYHCYTHGCSLVDSPSHAASLPQVQARLPQARKGCRVVDQGGQQRHRGLARLAARARQQLRQRARQAQLARGRRVAGALPQHLAPAATELEMHLSSGQSMALACSGPGRTCLPEQGSAAAVNPTLNHTPT